MTKVLADKLTQSLKECGGSYSRDLRETLIELFSEGKRVLVVKTVKAALERFPENVAVCKAIIASDSVVSKIAELESEINGLQREADDSAAAVGGKITSILEKHGVHPERFRSVLNAANRVDRRILNDRLGAAGLDHLQFLHESLAPDAGRRSAGVTKTSADKPDSTGSGPNVLVNAAGLLKNPEAAELFFTFVKKDGRSGSVRQEFLDTADTSRIRKEYQKHEKNVRETVKVKFDTPLRGSGKADQRKQSDVPMRILHYLKELHDFNILKRKDLFKSTIILRLLFEWFDSPEIKEIFQNNPGVASGYEQLNKLFSAKLARLDFVFDFEKQVVGILQAEAGKNDGSTLIRKAKITASRKMKDSAYFSELENPILKNLQIRISRLFNFLSRYYVPALGTETPEKAEVLKNSGEFDSFADARNKAVKGYIGELAEIEEFRKKERQIIDGFNSDLDGENIEQLYAMVDSIPLFRTKKQQVTYGELLRQLMEGPLKSKAPAAKIRILDNIIENFEQTNKPEVLIDRLRYFKKSIEREPRLLRELMADLKTRNNLDDHVSYLLTAMSDEQLSMRAPNLLLRLYGMVSAIQSNDKRFVKKMIEEIGRLPVWKQEIVYQYILELQQKFKGNKSLAADVERIRESMEKTIGQHKELEKKAAAEKGMTKEAMLLDDINDFLGKPEFALDNMDDPESGDIDFDMGEIEDLDDLGSVFSDEMAAISINSAADMQEKGISGRPLDQLMEKDQQDRILGSTFADRLHLLEKMISSADDPTAYQDILEVSKRIFYEIDPLQEINDKIAIMEQWKQVDYAAKCHICDFLDKQLDLLRQELSAAGLLSELYKQLATYKTKGEQINFLKSVLNDPAWEKQKAVVTRLLQRLTREPEDVNMSSVDRFLSDLDSNDNNQLKGKLESLQRLSFRADNEETALHIEFRKNELLDDIRKLREEEEESTLGYLAGRSKKEQEKSNSFAAYPDIAALINYVNENCKSPGARQKFIREQELYYSEHGEEAAPEYPDMLKLVRYLFSPLSSESKVRLQSLVNRQDSKFINFEMKEHLLHLLREKKEISDAMAIDTQLIPAAAVRLALLHPRNNGKNTAQKLLFLKETLPANEDFCTRFGIGKQDIQKVFNELEMGKRNRKSAAEQGGVSASDLLHMNADAPSGQLGTGTVEPGGDKGNLSYMKQREEEISLSGIEISKRQAETRKFYEKYRETIDNDVQAQLKKQADREKVDQIKDNAHKVYQQFQKDTNKVLNGLLKELAASEVETISGILTGTLLPVFRNKHEHEFSEQEKQKLHDIIFKLENINRYVVAPCLVNKSDQIDLETVCVSSKIDASNHALLMTIIDKLDSFWQLYIEHFEKTGGAGQAERFQVSDHVREQVPDQMPDEPAMQPEDEAFMPQAAEDSESWLYDIGELPLEPDLGLPSQAQPDMSTEQGSAGLPDDTAVQADSGAADKEIDSGVLNALIAMEEFSKPHKIIIDSAQERARFQDDLDLRNSVLTELSRRKRIFSYDGGKSYIGEGKLVAFYGKHKKDRLFSSQDRLSLVYELKQFLNGIGSDSDSDALARKCRFLGIDYTAENHMNQYQQFMNSLDAWKQVRISSLPQGGGTSRSSGPVSAATGRTQAKKQSPKPLFSGRKKQPAKTASAGKKKSVSARPAAAGKKAAPRSKGFSSVHSEMIKHINKKKKKITQILVNMVDNLYSKEELVNMNTLYLGQPLVKVSKKIGRAERNRNVLDLISKFSVFNPSLLEGMLDDDTLLGFDGYYDSKQVAAAIKKKLKELG